VTLTEYRSNAFPIFLVISKGCKKKNFVFEDTSLLNMTSVKNETIMLVKIHIVFQQEIKRRKKKCNFSLKNNDL